MSENTENTFDELKKISKKISVILKLIFSIALMLSIVAGFVFAITYMRSNGFFSYEIFSANNIWIFLLAGIYMVMTLVAACGLLIYGIFICEPKNSQQKQSQHDLNIDEIIVNRREAYSKYNEKKLKNESYCEIRLLRLYLLYKACKLFFKIINFFSKVFNDGRTYVGLNIFFAIFICISIGINWFLVVYIYFFILLLILFLLLYSGVKEIKNKIELMVSILVFTLFMYFATLLPFSDIHAGFYKIFLQSRSLASDHAEIYLKNENRSVRGKLIFDDGKYAYVEFNRTDRDYGGIGAACDQIVRKKVPSEDVSILVPSKQ